jgi:uncharacterized membrane protein YfcA
MTITEAVILFVAAVVGGTLNAVAGGGSFVTFPALVFTGIPPITANATSTVALWPGSIASAAAYRNEFNAERRTLILLGSSSLIGGVIGAILLLKTPQATFDRLVPLLLLLATVLFTFGGSLTKRLRGHFADNAEPTTRSTVLIVAVQFVVGIYGGYFGGGLGIIILAVLAILGMTSLHRMNALKTLLQACVNGVAVLTFIVANAVTWPQALVMIVGSIVGGYGAAHYARRVDPRIIRGCVTVVGFAMTIYFFVR